MVNKRPDTFFSRGTLCWEVRAAALETKLHIAPNKKAKGQHTQSFLTYN